MVSVLFVCMGNICRSPMAEGAFRNIVAKAGLDDHFTIDSAGTIGYHSGNAPDKRAQKVANANGTDISGLRARQVHAKDFETFDYILAMDHENLADLSSWCPEDKKHKLAMFLPHAPHLHVKEMPDPYYGHERDFEMCFSAALDAAEGLLDDIKKHHFGDTA